MSFTRKFLAAMGIEAEKVDEIMNAHTEVTEGLKADRDKYRADAEKLSEVQAELDGVKKDLEKANATIAQAEKDDYKAKYESEKAEKEKLKADYDAEKKAAAEDAAITEWATAHGYSEKGAKMIVKHGGLRGKFKLSDDGKAEIPDELSKAIESEWEDYKKPPEKKETATFQKPPANNGTKSVKTKEEIMKIKDSGERQKAIAENLELFGIEKE